jgi:hypothetical protein
MATCLFGNPGIFPVFHHHFPDASVRNGIILVIQKEDGGEALWPDREIIFERLRAALLKGYFPLHTALASHGDAGFDQIHILKAQAEAQRALCTEQGFTMYLAFGTIEWGAALAAQGTWAEGLAQMRQGLADYRASGQFPWLFFLGLLAEACGRAGQVEEGLRALHEALEALQTTEERMYEAELYRLRCVLLLQQSAAARGEAEASVQQALTVARRQQAKSLELRAAMSLSRLWQQQGKRQEAHNLLAPIYHWFTEGLDTGDLQEAKALLDALEG